MMFNWVFRPLLTRPVWIVFGICFIGAATRQYCPLLKQSDLEVIEKNCSSTAPGYICQKLGCTQCEDMGHLQDSCVEVENRCFLFFRKTLTWYEALEKCYKRNLLLANETIPQMYLGWVNTELRCSHFWVDIPVMNNEEDQGYTTQTNGPEFSETTEDSTSMNKGRAPLEILPIILPLLSVVGLAGAATCLYVFMRHRREMFKWLCKGNSSNCPKTTKREGYLSANEPDQANERSQVVPEETNWGPEVKGEGHRSHIFKMMVDAL